MQSAFVGPGSLSTYEITNGVRYDVEVGSYNFLAGVAAGAPTASGLALLSSDSKVGATTTLSHGSLASALTATANTYLLFHITPTHDEGYCEYAASQCTVDSVLKECYCF